MKNIIIGKTISSLLYMDIMKMVVIMILITIVIEDKAEKHKMDSIITSKC